MRVNQSGNNPAITNTDSARPKHHGKVGGTEATKEAKESRNSRRSAESAPLADSARPEISSKAHEFARAKSIASGAPDVREEKIAELKKRIAAGGYHIDADAVADKMVDEHLASGLG